MTYTITCPICTEPYTSIRQASTCDKPACRKAMQRLKKEDNPVEVLTPTGPIAEIIAEVDKAMAHEGLDWKMTNSNPITPEQQALVDEALAEPLARLKVAKKAMKDAGFTVIDAASLPPTTFIPTGHADLDAIIQGFPRKRITEVYGPATTGKTSLMLQTIAQMDPKLKVLYIDLENAIDAKWAESKGITPGRMDLANPFLLEDAAQHVLDSITKYDLIVFDSVASALVKTEETNELGNANVGVKPRIMTSFMRKLVGPLSRTDCAVVFINQEKPSIGDMYAPKWYCPGGLALPYAASLRLRLTSNKADRMIIEGTKVGKKVKAEITKNKVGTPDREAQFLITY